MRPTDRHGVQRMARSCTSPLRVQRFLTAAGSSLKMHIRQATRLLIALMDVLYAVFLLVSRIISVFRLHMLYWCVIMGVNPEYGGCLDEKSCTAVAACGNVVSSCGS